MIVRLRREYGRFITSGGQIILIGIGAEIDTPLGWISCTGIIALVSLAAWMSTYRRARVIDDTPTSKIASAAQGYAELLGHGHALEGLPVISPLTHQPCLWYRFLVERRQDDKWVNDSSGESDASFILDDGTGECLIDPYAAEILPGRKDTWTAGNYRYTECLLLDGETIYALGEFRTRNSADFGLSRTEAIKALLAEWKKSPQELLKKFDLDGNGELDMREWELARAQAHRDVDDMLRQARAEPGLHTMNQPGNGRLFLISSLPPEKISRRYRWWGIAHLVIFFAALAGMATAFNMSP